MRRAAPAHIVFRMDFEKPKLGTRVEDRLEMLGLEPDADTRCGKTLGRMMIGDGHGSPSLASRLEGIGVFARGLGHVTSTQIASSKKFLR